MSTQVITVDPQNPQAQAIRTAADVLQKGGLVAFPTETVYGLGANALDAAAIERIYTAKQRPSTDPIIVHIHDTAQLIQLAVDLPSETYILARSFWPGPLTVVLRRAPGVPDNLAAGMDTVAVRMPAHPVARDLLRGSGLPIAAPSANTFTRPSATTAAHVLEDLDGRIDLILDGGPANIGLESTVLDLTPLPAKSPVVLRPGGVLVESLRRYLPDVRLSPRYTPSDEAAPAPGQMLKHYSPRARVVLFTGSDRDAVIAAMQRYAREQGQDALIGALVPDDDCAAFEGLAVVAPLGPDLVSTSRTLFAQMRDLDAHDVDLILARDLGQEGLGTVIWDRLVRAAESNVITI